MAFDRLKHWLFGDPTSFRHSVPRTPQAAIREALRQHRENVAWLQSRAAVPGWRVFPPMLLLLIACMVATMAGLKALAEGHAFAQAVLGTLDCAVAVALAASAHEHGPMLGKVAQPSEER